MWPTTTMVLFIALLTACAHAPEKAREETAAPTISAGNGQEEFAQALDAIKHGNDQEALIMFRGLSEKHPEMTASLMNLALLELKAGNLAAAEAAFLQASKLKPELAAAYNGLGIVYRQMGRFQDAEAAYLKALQYFPDYTSAHLNLGILYDIYLGRPGAALEHYERHQALNGGKNDKVSKWIAEVKQQQAKHPESQQ